MKVFQTKKFLFGFYNIIVIKFDCFNDGELCKRPSLIVALSYFSIFNKLNVNLKSKATIKLGVPKNI